MSPASDLPPRRPMGALPSADNGASPDPSPDDAPASAPGDNLPALRRPNDVSRYTGRHGQPLAPGSGAPVNAAPGNAAPGAFGGGAYNGPTGGPSGPPGGGGYQGQAAGPRPNGY